MSVIENWNPKKLRLITEDRELSRADFAVELGMAKKSLNNIMRKKNPTKPSATLVRLMAAVLGVSVEEITENLEEKCLKPKRKSKSAKSVKGK